MIIHSTKKLLAKLPVNSDGLLPKSEISNTPKLTSGSPLGPWHANLLLLQKRNCVLFVHDATRFPVFIKELRKPEFAELQWHFEDAFMNTLLKIEANQLQLDAAAKSLSSLTFDNICNRSVQGTMNQMAGDIEHMLWFDNARVEDLSAYRTGAWLADRPCTIKGQKDCVWPEKAMLALLDEIATGTLADDQDNLAPTNNVLHMDDYR